MNETGSLSSICRCLLGSALVLAPVFVLGCASQAPKAMPQEPADIRPGVQDPQVLRDRNLQL